MAQAMAASMPRGLGAHRSEKWHDNIRSLPEMTKGMRAVVRVFAAALIAAGLAVVPAVSETDPRTHTGHQHHKIPGSRKHLKSVVLRLRQPRATRPLTAQPPHDRNRR